MLGKIHTTMYGDPSLAAAVTEIRDLAKKHDITGHAAALRWTVYHGILDGSKGDSVIFTVSSMKQLEQTLVSIEAGELPSELAIAMNGIYDKLEGKGPEYHPGSTFAKLAAEVSEL